MGEYSFILLSNSPSSTLFVTNTLKLLLIPGTVIYYSFQLVQIKLSFSGHKMITSTTKMFTVCLVLALLRPAVAEVDINKLTSGQTIYVRKSAKKIVPVKIQMCDK